MSNAQLPPRSGTPVRTTHSYDQTLEARPEEVFPLLCPVRERDWVPGWRTDWVLSASGVAENGCIFQTPESAELPAALWVVTGHEPEAWRVAMVRVVPGHTVTRLEIALAPLGDHRTRARVRYEFTALGVAGEAFVAQRTKEWYAEFMRGWERAMNHYLTHGDLLPVSG